MYTYMAVVALATSVTSANLSSNPTWLNDYGQAHQRVAAVKKPMAIFVGSGQDGFKNVIRDGGLEPAVNKLLAEKFVCVYIDTNTATGKTLAAQFEVASRGLIISDRTGSSQAFSLSGTLTKAELAQTLAKYADTSKEVRTTETVVREVPAGRTIYAPQYVPAYRTRST